MPSPGPNDLAPQAGDGDFATIPEPRIQARSCFPDQVPNTVRIELGEQKTIDFKLGSMQATHVRGTISPAVQQSYVTLTPVDAFGILNQQGTMLDGRFEFNRVEPGQYRLEAGIFQTPDQHHAIAVERITVEKGGLTAVQLTPQPSGKVDVVFEGESDPKIPHPAQIGFQPAEPDTAFTLWAAQGTDGNSRLENLSLGRYYLVKRMVEPYCVESATLDGEDVLYRAFNIPAGASAQLRIKLTTQCASFSGVVLSHGKPAYVARIAVLVSGTPKQPGDVYIDSTNETGEFSMECFPPGRYLLWAWRQDGPSYTGPSSLSDAEKFAVVVNVRKGEKASGLVLRDLEEAAR